MEGEFGKCVDPDPQHCFQELKYALVTGVRLMMFTGINKLEGED